ncbi:MAG: LysR family transcriptional regulator [Rhodocyclales bacterium]|nr:LysR family transcriptional regulator [Rhodocyclales bacterium]
MRRKIPSTGALVAFEAASRHGSFTQAAKELILTHSAICRQIAGLEEFLGVRLFTRTKRGVVLTEAGRGFSRQISARLDGLERDTLSVMERRGGGAGLELAVVPSFATKWLLPRLGGFLREHPGVTVHMDTRTRPFLFDETDFDAAIYFGDAGWPGTAASYLMREHPVAVCSPGLIAPAKTLEPEQLAELPLLQQSTRPYAWRHWFSSLGLSCANDMVGARFELFSMLAQAAIEGLGVALIPPQMIEDELASGRLIAPLPHRYVSEKAYYLIYPEHKTEAAPLAAFRNWLVGEAARYRAENELE